MNQFASAFEKPRPPYLRFEKRPVERRDIAGNVTFVDVDYVLITQPGGKDTLEKVWSEWFPYIERLARDGIYPAEWLPLFRERYADWQKGQASPVHGTDIKNWPAVTPAEVKILQLVGLLAVEDVASMNEEVISRCGMGGRALKQKALDWLAGKEGASLTNQLAAKQAEIDRLTIRVNELSAAVSQMQGRLQQQAITSVQAIASSRPSLESRLEAAQASLGPTVRDDDVVADAIGEVLG